jgi:hypothetical protein
LAVLSAERFGSNAGAFHKMRAERALTTATDFCNRLLCDTQRLDARDVVPHRLRRVPEIDRSLGVQPELRAIAEQAGQAISGLTARRPRSNSLIDWRETPAASASPTTVSP